MDAETFFPRVKRIFGGSVKATSIDEMFHEVGVKFSLKKLRYSKYKGKGISFWFSFSILLQLLLLLLLTQLLLSSRAIHLFSLL